MKRLDLALVELGLAPSRTKAQQMIEAGEVEVLRQGHWQVIQQSSHQLKNPSLEYVRKAKDSEVLKYVSRGGLKLEGALRHLQLDVGGWRCLDLGLSTGGFSDCLLQAGASEVFGVDVGHGQLHPSLEGHPRLQSFEGVNVKNLASFEPFQEWAKRGLDFCVADLSFISLLSLLSDLAGWMPKEARFLGLVKPQFEVGANHLNKSGIVKDPQLFREVEFEALKILAQTSWEAKDFFPSLLKGQDGNQEFFLFARVP